MIILQQSLKLLSSMTLTLILTLIDLKQLLSKTLSAPLSDEDKVSKPLDLFENRMITIINRTINPIKKHSLARSFAKKNWIMLDQFNTLHPPFQSPRKLSPASLEQDTSMHEIAESSTKLVYVTLSENVVHSLFNHYI
ncbi:hypothetical protein BDB01DRAFT_835001 [Pilobolus umbonatus]|nr:hypothetical protein BDB01DRAFT_835001 [Pilobolus umbonatus]